ncbi:MAG: phosphatidylserine decarboxylase family protein [Bacteroidales bacterium]|jgi:phosphatidylserine decarboxylase
MYIHKEGRLLILISLAILLLLAVILAFIPVAMWIGFILLFPFITLFLLIIWFFRIPSRHAEKDDNTVIAPADGKIVVIEKFTETEYFHDERIQVSIFMSPLNVHQNIYPIAGTIVYTKYHKGNYLVAWHPKSSELNERHSVVIRNHKGTEIMVKQIAGAVARRICNYSEKGEKVGQCDEMGFIRFGSRVDIILPVTARILCNLNQVSRNKITKIAELV